MADVRIGWEVRLSQRVRETCTSESPLFECLMMLMSVTLARMSTKNDYCSDLTLQWTLSNLFVVMLQWRSCTPRSSFFFKNLKNPLSIVFWEYATSKIAKATDRFDFSQDDFYVLQNYPLEPFQWCRIGCQPYTINLAPFLTLEHTLISFSEIMVS
jgi:hypothetical protein